MSKKKTRVTGSVKVGSEIIKYDFEVDVMTLEEAEEFYNKISGIKD